jgi:ubiquitin carboxyl-terminal hydrolase 16/45
MLHKAWTLKDNGGGTSGPGESSSRHAMTLRALLKELARKYDQYDEFAQQDAHELLRHLLDSMEMEEKDVIKRIGQARTAAGAPPAAPAPNALSVSLAPTEAEQPEVELVPFVDVLFGGLLASVVVCETCKSVSHTYEGFLDLSLSMRNDDDAPARQRKRDRFRGLASRLAPKGKHLDHSHATMSEPEGSDSEHGRHRHLGLGHGRAPRQPSSDADSTHSSGLNRSSSTKLGSRVRPSFSFRRKDKDKKDKDKSKAGTSPDKSDKSPGVSPQLDPSARLEPAPPVPDSGPPTPRAGSPDPGSSTPSLPSSHHHHHHHHAAAPTPAQAAYIQRILYGPPGPPDVNDPLAKLRAAHAGEATPPKDYGLVESLKSFTAVEVLEGDNAFACHKCWKIKVGRYSQHSSETQTPANGHVPSIAVEGTDDARSGRDVPRNPGIVRAPSPLRQVVQTPEYSPAPSGSTSLTAVTSNGAYSVDSYTSSSTACATDTSSASGSTAFPAAESESDGLSDSSSDSDDEPPPDLQRRSFLRPGLSRRQSRNKHFVLRRAFKRYLIAKAPEVLVFHIKRFKQTTSSVYSTFSSLKKLDDFVSFPETLDVSPFMAPNRNDFKVMPTPSGPRAPYQDWPSPEQCPDRRPMPYRLYAVVVHLGTMLGGHYVAYVLVDPERLFAPPGDPVELMERLALDEGAEKPDRRVWCYASDTEIRLASVQEVMSARAYLCFVSAVVFKLTAVREGILNILTSHNNLACSISTTTIYN